MRCAALALTIILISFSFAGCTSGTEPVNPEDEIPDNEREDVLEEANQSTTITLENCEERGGTWIEESNECSFEPEISEEEHERLEEETGPISIPPCNVTASEGSIQQLTPRHGPRLKPVNGLQ